MKEYVYNFWDTAPAAEIQCKVSFFMPNGMFISMLVSKYDTMGAIKKKLWRKAATDGLARGLEKNSQNYVFTTVDPNAKDVDESMRLIDLKPIFCMFRLKQRDSELVCSQNERNIKLLVGPQTHSRLQALDRSQIKDFRNAMMSETAHIANQRTMMRPIEKVLYQFPPEVVKSPIVPENLKKYLKEGNKIRITAIFSEECTGTSTTICIDCKLKPADLLKIILEKLRRKNIVVSTDPPPVLRICGLNEYLCGNYSLIQFTYIQECLRNGSAPKVFLQNIADVPIERNDYTLRYASKYRKKAPKSSRNKILSWIVERPFQVVLHNLQNLYSSKATPILLCLQLGLYHGGTALCKIETVDVKYSVNDEGICEIEENVTFDIDVCNLPRMTRLCVAICEKKNNYSLGWFNTMVYDFQNTLKALKRRKYNTWPSVGNNKRLNPLGTVEHSCADDQVNIVMSFVTYRENWNVMYPEIDNMIEKAQRLNNLDRNCGADTDRRSIQEVLQPYLKFEQLNGIVEQDRNKIWNKRNDCILVPESLPCLLCCIEWNNSYEVAEIYRLLEQWPPLPVDKALEMLDYKTADCYIRSFAVKSLKKIDDRELMLYLLQLLQAIKHESYLKNDLVWFLIERALKNQRIGHFLFWHLRSELGSPCSEIRFGLILEAFLKGSTHLTSLARQLGCLNQLKLASSLLRSKPMPRENARSWLREFLNKQPVHDSLTDFISPLDPRYHCKAVKPDMANVMDSKMRPIWIVAENVCSFGDDFVMIFKQGDDLRQDMLILQMIKIFDTVWKDNGYDFRLNPYGCISMECKTGMIEVVTQANTIANIQKTYLSAARSAFDKTSLLKWLREKNKNNLERAIEEFMYSCAGYCVATYVLGVADRHSDNIMLRENGQLFHIDYGHILGNFKEKWGIRREWVPFVLTSDFVYVITNGKTNHKNFHHFQEMCEQAFMLLRQHGSLILSLFTMMISTGLPELSSENDLKFLRDSLALDKSDQEALMHFQSKFQVALDKSWTTSMNWFTHNVAKNNC